MSPKCPLAHYSLYIILVLFINLNWRCLISQPIILRIPRKADMKKWMYHLQGRAMGEIQLMISWSYSLQPKVPGAEKNLVTHRILHIPAVSVFLALLSLLSVQQALVRLLLYLLHLLDLLNASSTALNPIHHIHKHPNWSPVYYIC